MEPSLQHTTISYADFQHHLTLYPAHLPPARNEAEE